MNHITEVIRAVLAYFSDGIYTDTDVSVIGYNQWIITALAPPALIGTTSEKI